MKPTKSEFVARIEAEKKSRAKRSENVVAAYFAERNARLLREKKRRVYA
jgi:hypothetical protein